MKYSKCQECGEIISYKLSESGKPLKIDHLENIHICKNEDTNNDCIHQHTNNTSSGLKCLMCGCIYNESNLEWEPHIM